MGARNREGWEGARGRGASNAKAFRKDPQARLARNQSHSALRVTEEQQEMIWEH